VSSRSPSACTRSNPTWCPADQFGGRSSPCSQPPVVSDIIGSRRSQSKHWNVRRPLPPGGRAKTISDWHFGQVGRSAFFHGLSSIVKRRRPIIYFARIPSQEEMETGDLAGPFLVVVRRCFGGARTAVSPSAGHRRISWDRHVPAPHRHARSRCISMSNTRHRVAREWRAGIWDSADARAERLEHHPSAFLSGPDCISRCPQNSLARSTEPIYAVLAQAIRR
jgi:hypothetical protein